MAKSVTKQKITRHAYETALKDYVRDNNDYSSLAAERDKRVVAIDAEYEMRFLELKDNMDVDFEVVKQYCEENKQEMFTEPKSIEAFGAHIGFREGKYKVMVLDGSDEKQIVEVMARYKAMQPFLRKTLALDKVKIVKKRPKGLEKLGLKVDKEESFFLEPVVTEAY